MLGYVLYSAGSRVGALRPVSDRAAFADALYPAIVPGARVDLGYLLWSFAAAGGSAGGGDLLVRVVELLRAFAGVATGPEWWRFAALEGLLVGLTLTPWATDGRPGLGLCARADRPRRDV